MLSFRETNNIKKKGFMNLTGESFSFLVMTAIFHCREAVSLRVSWPEWIRTRLTRERSSGFYGYKAWKKKVADNVDYLAMTLASTTQGMRPRLDEGRRETKYFVKVVVDDEKNKQSQG